jgi:hypothetical protein
MTLAADRDLGDQFAIEDINTGVHASGFGSVAAAVRDTVAAAEPVR